MVSMKPDTGLGELLASLGLRRADVATYEALLAHGSISIRKLAAKSGINRGSTYEALKRLVIARKNLRSYSR